MAKIHTIVGNYELAMDELEFILSIPSWSSAVYLRAEPIFEPLRDLPRFEQILRDFEARNQI